MGALLFKIFQPASSFRGVDYNEKKQKEGIAKMVHFENFGYLNKREVVSKEDFKDYFDAFSGRNPKVKKPQFHAIMSCKGESFGFDELKQKALIMMHELGYAKCPILIYEHNDTHNRHVHIVSCRVGEDGKKINDSFENLRANQILSRLLEISPDNAYKNALEQAKSYRFTTGAQFMLMMKKQGYKPHKSETGYAFYKFGTHAGDISFQELNKKLNENEKNFRPDLARIRALIYKYEKQIDNRVITREEMVRNTSKEKEFYSPLTDFMKDRFGIEFVFFAAQGKDTPYGYTIIDHKSKEIFKGSEVMKLGRLMNGQDALPLQEGGGGIGNLDISAGKTKGEDTFSAVSAIGMTQEAMSFDMESIVNAALASNEVYSGRENKRGKKKKRRPQQED